MADGRDNSGGFTYRSVQEYASVVRTANNRAEEGNGAEGGVVGLGEFDDALHRVCAA